MSSDIKNTSIYLFQIAVSGVLMLMLLPITTSYLTSDELGQFVLAQVWMGVVTGIANLGMNAGYERNYFVYEKTDKASQLLSTALVFVFINLSIVALILWTFDAKISQLVLNDPGKNFLLLLVFAGSACNTLAQFYLIFFKNSGFALRYVQFVLLQAVCNFVAVVLLYYFSDMTTLALGYGWFFSNALMLFALTIHFHNKVTFFVDRYLLADMLRISLPLTPKVFFGIINTHFDKIMLGMLGSTALVGIYQVGQTIALMIYQFMVGLHRAFDPNLYRKLFSRTQETNPKEINDYILPFFHLAIFVALLIALFAKELITVFFSTEYMEASIVINILSIHFAVLFFGMVAGTQLTQAKKTVVSMYLMPVGMLINVGLNIPLITHWGVAGAAWATTIGSAIVTVIGFILAQKYNKVHWNMRNIFTTYVVFIAMAFFALLDNISVLKISSDVSVAIKILSAIFFAYMSVNNGINKRVLARIWGKLVH